MVHANLYRAVGIDYSLACSWTSPRACDLLAQHRLMIILAIWLGASLLVAAGWAVVGLLLGERLEANVAIEAEAEDEAA